MNFDLNDPKITAYALGELSGFEKEKVEEFIRKSPEAQALVREIQDTAQLLNESLHQQKPLSLSDVERKVISDKWAEKAPSRFRWSQLKWFLPIPIGALAVGLALIATPNFQRFDKKRAAQMAQTPLPAEVQTTSQPESLATVPSDGRYAAPSGSRSHVDQKQAIAGLAKMKAQPYAIAPAGSSAPSSAAAVAGRTGYGSGYAVLREKESADRPSRRNLVKKGELDDSKNLADFAGPRDELALAPQEFNTEAYDHISDNPFLTVKENPLSTFSIDVDTASYSNIRRFLLQQKLLPPKDAVRIEEMVNYFKYDYPQPKTQHPFSVNVETATAPWNKEHQIARVALKGREIETKVRPTANLVFLIDTSGSMDEPNKLPLLKAGFKQMVENLNDRDRVAIVVYAGSSGTVLPSTASSQRGKILESLDRLQAGGSTNGGEGIQLAYKIAQENFIKDGTNRVILATDGDFNVGVTNQGDLVRLIEEKAKSGTFLTVLGFGMGNLKDSTLEKLADKGNGNYSYIDTLQEGRRVLVEQMGATLVTIAKDVKIQIEFNPARVAGYRLIGYENRLLAKEDFNDDTKDAGEIGAGHTVTAIYELVPAGKSLPGPSVDPLKYQEVAQPTGTVTKSAPSNELMTVKLRYKQPNQDKSVLIEVPVPSEKKEFSAATGDFKFATSVAGFGMILRDSPHKGDATLTMIADIAESNLKFRGQTDEFRKEFLELVKTARQIKGK